MAAYEDYHKGFVALYMNQIFHKIITFGDIMNYDTILDFGGGYGHIKDMFPGDVTVYDIVPELSDIKDYTTWNGNIILCCHVLEHIPKDDIKVIMDNFVKINHDKLIVALPTENIFSKIGVWFTKLKETYEDIPHVSNYKEVNEIVEKYFTLSKRKKVFFGMTEISVYTK